MSRVGVTVSFIILWINYTNENEDVIIMECNTETQILSNNSSVKSDQTVWAKTITYIIILLLIISSISSCVQLNL